MLKVKTSPDQAKEINRKVNKIFDKTDINPTPMNYLVWYHYFLGENEALIEEIKYLSKHNQKFNDRIGVRLYHDFIETHNPDEEKYDYEVKKFVDNIVYSMNALHEDTLKRSSDISALSEQITEKKAADLKELAEALNNNAQILQKNSAKVHGNLVQNAKEINQLRKQLEEARKEALIDDLTELGNRKAFTSLLQDLTIYHKYKPEPMCLIMTDIDDFSDFNKNYGHHVGDSILRFYSKLLDDNTGQNAKVWRYGGEEFAILLRNSSLDEASQKAEEIREALQELKLSLKDSDDIIKTITASFGVAFFHGDEDNMHTFIERADRSLLKAKKSGKNQVVHEMALG